MTVTDYRLRGRTVITQIGIAGLAHAWSAGAARESYGDAKGPDASRMVWAFVARQLKSRDGSQRNPVPCVLSVRAPSGG